MDNPFIGRIVVLISPIIASLATVIANWAQDVIGADLDETQLSVFLTGVFVSVMGAIITWLYNRGKYEVVTSIENAAQQVEQTGGPGFEDPVPPTETAGPAVPPPSDRGA